MSNAARYSPYRHLRYSELPTCHRHEFAGNANIVVDVRIPSHLLITIYILGPRLCAPTSPLRLHYLFLFVHAMKFRNEFLVPRCCTLSIYTMSLQARRNGDLYVKGVLNLINLCVTTSEPKA